MHYQKKRSREVAIRERLSMQKLLDENKSVENDCEIVEQLPAIPNKVNSTNLTDKLSTHRAGVRFTSDEDDYIRLGIKKFGLSWSKILRHPDFHFNSCRVPNTLRKIAKALKCHCNEKIFDPILNRTEQHF